METFYIIRNIRTGQMIEAHDELSREWGQGKVKTHNDLYPNDKWEMVEEVL